MSWWRGSSPPMKDCRKSRQPADLDNKIFGRGPAARRLQPQPKC
jgi:hypothetical protein